MNVLTRYILREISTFTGLTLSAFMGILLTARMVKLTSLVVNKGVSASEIITIFLSIIPSFLEIALPISALLGIMLAFARLSGDSEITVMRASGISIKQLMKPVLAFCLTLTTLSFIVSAYLRPIGNTVLSKSFFRLASSQSLAGLSEGVFSKLGPLTFYAAEIDYDTGRIDRVIIDDRRNRDGRQLVLASSGRISSSEKTQTINIKLYNGEIHSATGAKNYNITAYSENEIRIEPGDPDAEQTKGRKPRELLIPELRLEGTRYKEILELKQRGEDFSHLLLQTEVESLSKSSERDLVKRIQSLQFELVRKYSYPVACLLLGLIAMPLGIQPARSQKTWGATLSAGLSLAVLVTYYGILSLGITLAKSGALHPTLALWLPNICFAFITYYTLKRVFSEQWQTILHGFEALVKRAQILIDRVS